MTQKLLNRVYVRTQIEHENGEGVPRAVEGSVLLHACTKRPQPQLGVHAGVVAEIPENKLVRLAPLSHIAYRMRADVEVLLGLRLLLPEDNPRELSLLHHILPAQLHDVALPQSGKAREQERVLEGRVPALRGRHRAQLLDGKILALGLLLWKARNAVHGIHRDDVLAVRMIQARAKLVEVRHLAVLGQRVTRQQLAVLGAPVLTDGLLVKVVPEPLDPFGRDLPECHLLVCNENLEVLEARVPVAPVPAGFLRPQPLLAHPPEVVEEDHVLVVPLLKPEAVVLKLYDPLAPDRLGKGQRFPVLVSVLARALRHKVKLQEFIRPDAVDVDVQK